MIVYPNAKINLGLNIYNQLESGYHELQSFFLPIPIYDCLEIKKIDSVTDFKYASSGISIDGGISSCEQVFQLLKTDFDIPNVSMHLHKQIPIGAGLGGGSADASFALLELNRLFDLGLSIEQLKTYAKIIGADCPFFIENTCQFVTGIGEKMTPVDASALKGKWLVLIYPNQHISTKMAYSNLKINTKQEWSNFEIADFESYKSVLINDFETQFLDSHPEFNQIKLDLYAKGAFYASMSGSGSAHFGLFHQKPSFKTILNYKLSLCQL
ncbi:MAG: 4-(cytidine 5'-diphospho)-2-C-methyl-D-erythritol kinase [Flavobacteriales bacterium]